MWGGYNGWGEKWQKQREVHEEKESEQKKKETIGGENISIIRMWKQKEQRKRRAGKRRKLISYQKHITFNIDQMEK